VPQWKEERREARTAVEERQKALSEKREREKELTQQLADLEAKAREASSVRESISDLEDRIQENEEEREELAERIQEADELLSESDAIQETYDRYEALQEERDALDEKRDLHRGIEKQIEQKKTALRKRTNKLERRLDRLEVERKGFKQNLEDCETKLAKRAAVEEALQDAQAARQQVQEMVATRRRRETLRQKQEQAERALVGARQQLQGELESLQAQIKEEQEAVEKADALDARIEELVAQKRRREELDERLETLEKEGKTVAESVQELAGQKEAKQEALEREESELQRFREAEGPTCPTCGKDLTPAHREEVETTLQSSIQDLDATLERLNERLEEKRDQRDQLRKQYATVREEHRELDGIAETLATAREQRRALEETTEALERHKEQVGRLQRQLQRRTYGADQRRRWQWCAQRLATLRFDDDRYEALQNRAAQFDRYSDRLRELNELEGRREELQRKIDEHDEEIQSIRQQLDDGTAVADLEDQIDELERQLDDLDFDPDRFREVRQALDSLSGIEEQVSELRNAKRNRDDWDEQRQRLQTRVADLREERAEAKDRLSELEASLDGKQTVEDELEQVAGAVEDAEADLQNAQQRLGMLNERLDQAARDRESLNEAEEELEECKRDRRIHKHLRTAFGKHGIPSLIIEETLPEIEERANDILDRLTDGRMHVRLETLKEKKSGGTKETLEIIITDEQGVPRPYETFSGGESFRVNFALRVALAQLLAERSGVRVRTLVIDEGFGTQDAEGIERLVEAIQAIRTDFAKILVITHLTELKQAFPVRIEVEKDPVDGSTFELVGA